MKTHQITRRDLIKAAGFAVSSVTLSACGRRQTEFVEVPPAPFDRASKTEFVDVRPLPFTWTTVASGEKGPGARSRHCFAFDRRAKTAVLFGGAFWAKAPHLRADTWELRDGLWSQVQVAEKPSARHRGAMVYDGRLSFCVLFGGQGNKNEMLEDTWTYSSGHWQRWQNGTGRQPSPRCGHSLAFNEAAGETVLFGGIDPSDNQLGDTWLFHGDAWWPLNGASPPARRYAAFAYDEELGGCVLHGGSEDDRGKKGFGDTWLFQDRNWTRLADGFNTDVRDDHGMAYHKAAKRLVMLEGIRAPRGILVRDANAWRGREAAPLLPRLQCSPIVWDDVLDGLVMHGGETRQGGPQFDKTWLLRRAEQA
jgi:Galactose oxidase, central domain